MLSPLLAAGWNDFAAILPIVVAVLVWVISHFAGQVQPKVPPPRRPMAPPQPGQQPPGGAQSPPNDSLQAEIEEFLRQAQQARGSRAGSQSRRATTPPPGAEPPRSRPPRRPVTQSRRGARRDETRPSPRPSPPPVIEVVETTPPRQSLAERKETEKFAQRAAGLSRMQEETDAEFQKHMQRVFAHDVSTLKPATLGLFEAAGAAARAESATVAAAAKQSAGDSQSAYAPTTARKQASDIALFLAGSKNIRDAIVLNEILSRPESRW